MVDLLTPILSAMINMSIENSVSKKQAYLTLLGIKSNYKVFVQGSIASEAYC
jgi:hypothetical protein